MFIAKKKEGVRPSTRFVFDDRDEAITWLENRIQHDPLIDEYDTREYDKLVYQNDDGVVGYVDEVSVFAGDDIIQTETNVRDQMGVSI